MNPEPGAAIGLGSGSCARRSPRQCRIGAENCGPQERARRIGQDTTAYDQRGRDSDAAVWRAVLPGLPDRQRYRQARPFRGPQLRGPRSASSRQAEEGAADAQQGQLGPARAPNRFERKGLPASHHPQEDRRARSVLRAVPPGERPAVDSGGRHHLLRRNAQVRAGRAGRSRRDAQGAGARGDPPRDRRAAPSPGAARRHRALRRRALHGPGGDLRPSPRGSRRADVRHDQREAHATERVTPGLALRAAAVSRREPCRGARHRPRAERSRGFAAVRRDQAAGRRHAAAWRRRRSRRN